MNRQSRIEIFLLITITAVLAIGLTRFKHRQTGGDWEIEHAAEQRGFAAYRVGTREEAIAEFRKWVVKQPALMRALPELRGKTLGCWCRPKACHGDVLVELLKAGGA